MEAAMQHPKDALKIHEQLKASLRIRGSSLAQLSRELGVTTASMSRVGLGSLRSARIERAIADALETTPEQLWPDRYEREDKMP